MPCGDSKYARDMVHWHSSNEYRAENRDTPAKYRPASTEVMRVQDREHSYGLLLSNFMLSRLMYGTIL